jgi:hypothetical protein
LPSANVQAPTEPLHFRMDDSFALHAALRSTGLQAGRQL